MKPYHMVCMIKGHKPTCIAFASQVPDLIFQNNHNFWNMVQDYTAQVLTVSLYLLARHLLCFSCWSWRHSYIFHSLSHEAMAHALPNLN